MPGVSKTKHLFLTALLALACAFSVPAANADDSSGYMDRMLMALSGQEPAPVPEPAPMAADPAPDIRPAAQNTLLPDPPAGGTSREPITELKLASSGNLPPAKPYENIAPEAGEAPRKTQTITASPDRTAGQAAPAIDAGAAYRLNIGDLLRVTVFGVTELTGSYRIDSAGAVTIPLVGELPARGRTKEDLQAEIARRLIDGGYYNSPSVTVEVLELAPFYILGEIENPGRYPYEPTLDIFKAIAIAGGYTPRAAKDKIVIIRDVNGKKTEIQADEGTQVLPGDSIKVKQRFF